MSGARSERSPWEGALGGRVRHHLLALRPAAERVRGAHLPAHLVIAMFVPVTLLALAANIAVTPPGEVADAWVHFDRAVEISQGSLIGQVHRGVGGDYLPVGAVSFDNHLARYEGQTHQEQRSQMAALGAIDWGHRQQFEPFASTTEYPPFAYLPGAMALAVAKLISDRVLFGYYLLEIINGLFFVGLVAWAIALFRSLSGLLLAAVAILPMTVSLAGSPSPDGILFGLAAVGCGLLYRGLRRSRPMTKGPPEQAPEPSARGWWRSPVTRDDWLAFAALALLTLAKPPYFPMVLLMGVGQAARKDLLGFLKRVGPFAALLAIMVAAWYLWGARAEGAFSVLKGQDISPIRQLHLLLTHPSFAVNVASLTLRLETSNLWDEFIGIMGWLNVWLQPWAYLGISAALAVLVVWRLANAKVVPWVTICALAVVVASAGLIFVTFYADWTPVGAPLVSGVQGRYFLPFAPALIAGFGSDRFRLGSAVTVIGPAATIWLALAGISIVSSTMALMGHFWA